uniref:Doublecortin domain-containing protein n=1 Tax=Chrysemys picta bellii TaxID=8478 RepID=A0A8C3PAP6_CHRPI
MTQAPADYLTTSSPYNYEQPLPVVARTNSITRVPPTKKITFFKSGDPQFGGVKMAINPRSFKSFNALMDDLSHRVPLPFGVRTITTPRGIHCISALDQLEDGGCYLCSDKKYVKPFSIGTGRRVGPQWNGRPASALRRGGQEGRHEDHSRPFSQQGPKILKKITLVKNGDIGVRRSIILNHRNARSFKTLLDEISELLQFTVKKLYTVDGKKVSLCDTWCWLFIPRSPLCPIRQILWPEQSICSRVSSTSAISDYKNKGSFSGPVGELQVPFPRNEPCNGLYLSQLFCTSRQAGGGTVIQGGPVVPQAPQSAMGAVSRHHLL